LSEEEKSVFRRLTTLVAEKQASSSETKSEFPSIPETEWPEVSATTGLRPPAFKVRMTVSGGTYVRSIVHDIGTALGCGAHVVQLRRTRQGRFVLHKEGEAVKELTEEEKAQMSRDIESQLNGEDEDEAEMNGTRAEGETDLEDKTLETGVVSGISTTCIPWDVLSKALDDRAEVIKRQEEARAEASKPVEPEIAEGEAEGGSSADGGSKPRPTKAEKHAQRAQEQSAQRSIREAQRAERMGGPLKAWEFEVLRRFIPVKVPANGGHNEKRQW
jgi:tRNA pseudouridine55 synthase